MRTCQVTILQSGISITRLQPITALKTIDQYAGVPLNLSMDWEDRSDQQPRGQTLDSLWLVQFARNPPEPFHQPIKEKKWIILIQQEKQTIHFYLGFKKKEAFDT